MQHDERNAKEPAIFLQSFELTRKIIESMGNLPKPSRYVIGRKMEERCLEFLILLNRLVGPTGIRIQSADEKERVLNELSIQLDEFRILLRMSREAGLYSAGAYQEINTYTQSIGRQLGGMIRANKKTRVIHDPAG